MNTETATSATPEAVCSTAMLGPVRRALDGLAFAAHQAGQYEKQLGDSTDVRDWIEYVMCEVAAEREAAVAAERERLARDVAGLHMAQSVNNQNHPSAWHDGVDAALEVIRGA